MQSVHGDIWNLNSLAVWLVNLSKAGGGKMVVFTVKYTCIISHINAYNNGINVCSTAPFQLIHHTFLYSFRHLSCCHRHFGGKCSKKKAISELFKICFFCCSYQLETPEDIDEKELSLLLIRFLHLAFQTLLTNYKMTTSAKHTYILMGIFVTLPNQLKD